MSDALRAAMRYPECHEEVTRGGELQPCEGIAVAVRIDPYEGGFYPVCSRHARSPMVRLADLVTHADRPGDGVEAREVGG